MGTTYPRQAPRVSLQETAYFDVRNWASPVARALLRVQPVHRGEVGHREDQRCRLDLG